MSELSKADLLRAAMPDNATPTVRTTVMRDEVTERIAIALAGRHGMSQSAVYRWALRVLYVDLVRDGGMPTLGVPLDKYL